MARARRSPGHIGEPAASPEDSVTIAHPLPQPLQAYLVPHMGHMSLRPDLNEGLEVGVVLSGAQERHWQETVIALRRGEVWLCNMLEPHAWRFTTRTGMAVSLVFAPEFLGQEMLGDVPWTALFSAAPAHRPRVADESTRRSVLQIGAEMRREIEERGPAWLTALKVCLLRLLLAIGRGWSPPTACPESSRSVPSSLDRVFPALKALRDGTGPGPSTVEVASACGLSAAQFSRVFRRAMGTSFGEFALRSRAAAAARYLLQTDLTTESVAQRTGFSDHSHLHRVFLRYYHCTPRQYRLHRGQTEGTPS